MLVWSTALRTLLATAALAALAGCDTLGMGFAPPAPAAPAGRAIDYRNDDLANLTFAVDLPQTLRPLPGGAVVTLDATGIKSSKHFKGTLALADGEAVNSVLPPPTSGRTYVLFGFAAKDKQAVRDFQKWLRAQPGAEPPVIALDVAPKLCETAPIDPATTTYGVLPALPGTALLPIVANGPIGRLTLDTGGQLPRCGRA